MPPVESVRMHPQLATACLVLVSQVMLQTREACTSGTIHDPFANSARRRSRAIDLVGRRSIPRYACSEFNLGLLRLTFALDDLSGGGVACV